MQAGTYGQWGALLAGGEVIYPTGYGTLVTAVIIICDQILSLSDAIDWILDTLDMERL